MAGKTHYTVKEITIPRTVWEMFSLHPRRFFEEAKWYLRDCGFVWPVFGSGDIVTSWLDKDTGNWHHAIVEAPSHEGSRGTGHQRWGEKKV